jgi:hypothetical protein
MMMMILLTLLGVGRSARSPSARSNDFRRTWNHRRRAQMTIGALGITVGALEITVGALE